MKKTNKISLNEAQLHRIIKESVKKVLKEDLSFYGENFIKDRNAYEYYRVNIHKPGSDEDDDSAYFDSEDEAYKWAVSKVKNKKLQAEMYMFEHEYDEVLDDNDIIDADWHWYTVIGYVDGRMNQF